jgi:hypothetical protein
MYTFPSMAAAAWLLAPAVSLSQAAVHGPESELVCTGPRPTTTCEPSVRLHGHTAVLVNRPFRRDDPHLIRLCQHARVVKLLRPSSGPSGVIMAVNPHPQPDVEVCGGHLVELYVGMPLHQPMPDLVREPVTVGQALERMTREGYSATARCMASPDTPDGGALVVDQWPLPGTAASLARKFAGGLETPGAHVTLWSSCESAKPCPPAAPCPVAQPCSGEEPLTPAAAGLAGLAGGWALAQVGRSRSRVPPRAVPEAKLAALPRTRVRPDPEPDDARVR